MKELYNGIKIIGLDHGYGNLKTASAIFPAVVTCFDTKPFQEHDLLIYDGKYYVIGDGHREFTSDKVCDQDHYILTLAGIAQELWANQLTNAKVHIAAGLPLTWVGSQREAFRKYLLQNEHVEYDWRGVHYLVDIVGADVYAQGYSAILPILKKFSGANMLCDIGNGTMNIMTINDGKPVMDQCFTEKFGTYQCMLKAREELMKRTGHKVPDTVIEKVLRTGSAEGIDTDYFDVIDIVAREYVNEIMRILREHEYDPKTMHLWFVGGGGCLVFYFGDYDDERVTIVDDIRANAKGYEFLAEKRLLREAKNK